MIDFKKYTHAALFAGGLLFGTAGLKLLSSKDAKNVYAHTTAAALRVKDCVMKGVDKVQESAADIVATAKDIQRGTRPPRRTSSSRTPLRRPPRLLPKKRRMPDPPLPVMFRASID